MLLSGFILPDGSEIHCVSCSSLKGHINAIKEYIKQDKTLGSYNLSDNVLDDYVVKTLGWIKIINVPYKYVFYSFEEQYEIVKRYENFGYIVVQI